MSLQRTLGTRDAVVVGLGAMLGAGVFAVLAPAAAAAGSLLLVALAVAAVVATCNALSSAQLAARYPEAGGSYVYGRLLLGPGWGFVAGLGFVVGKTASCAAIALTVGTYAVPGAPRIGAGAAVVLLTAVDLLGVTKTVRVTAVLLAAVLGVLGLVVVAALTGGTVDVARAAAATGASTGDVLEAAGLLFFAFAGYARIATLGEEVRDPARTIPRAVPLALGVTLVVYAAVSAAALLAVGPAALAASPAPLVTVVEAGRWAWASELVRLGAVLASLSVLLSLLAGVSRTVLAMARTGDLLRPFAEVSSQRSVPQRAQLAVSAAVLALVLTVDLRGAVAVSSVAVLAYYAVANASALRLPAADRRYPPAVAAVGLLGCTVLALSLPPSAVAAGVALLAGGAVARQVVRR